MLERMLAQLIAQLKQEAQKSDDKQCQFLRGLGQALHMNFAQHEHLEVLILHAHGMCPGTVSRMQRWPQARSCPCTALRCGVEDDSTNSWQQGVHKPAFHHSTSAQQRHRSGAVLEAQAASAPTKPSLLMMAVLPAQTHCPALRIVPIPPSELPSPNVLDDCASNQFYIQQPQRRFYCCTCAANTTALMHALTRLYIEARAPQVRPAVAICVSAIHLGCKLQHVFPALRDGQAIPLKQVAAIVQQEQIAVQWDAQRATTVH
jgi:hypothetical protein